MYVILYMYYPLLSSVSCLRVFWNLINIPKSSDVPNIFGYTACMRFPFKRFLILLMMLVLPVQSFASAARLGCAFSHQGPSSAPQMAQTDSAEALPACHTPEQPDPKPVQHDCKHCAACYMASALAIPSVFTPPVSAPSQSTILPFASPSFVGFIPDSPERPPRAPSA